jgi:uncharacterized cupin superfamily protein
MRRSGAQRHADLPLVAERVDDPAEPPAVLVADGTVVVRTPDGEHSLERGDLVRFLPGPDGAHKLMNRSESPART